MSVQNDGRTKEDWYNSDKVLSAWGFTDSKCHCCGIDNSSLDGLLMQCAKCRKAYYCSSKCFNAHLPVHNNFCSALPIACDPKGSKLDLFKLERRTVAKSDSEKAREAISVNEKIDRTPTARTNSMKTKVSSSNEKMEDERAEPKEEAAKQEDETTPEVKAVEDCFNEVNEMLEVSDGDDSLESIKEMMSKSFSYLRGPSSFEDKMSKSFSSFGRPVAYTSNEAAFTKEEIELRHAEMIQREYSWQIPDWVGSPLKPTPQGKLLKTGGNLASPVTDIHLLLEKGDIGWVKPEWTNAKLRTTPEGEQIKGRTLAEAPTL